ncbi:MAG: DUF4173 domain-containing protein [Oscillibacter sp.]|nr:DUF4173 domain-containing protein [Oscillibacter sp.]
MRELVNALPPEGAGSYTLKRRLAPEKLGRYRLFLVLTLGFCLLLVDGFLLYGPAAGLTATVFAWYALFLAWCGWGILERRSSRVLLLANLFLALTMALGSNWYFRYWNLLACAVLLPVQIMAGAASRPWWDPWMLWERCGLLLRGLFGNLWAPFAALVPGKRSDEANKRTLTVVLGLCGALVLVSVLLPVLISADALFAASTVQLQRCIRMLHFSDVFQRLFWALVFTPFVFGLLYALAHPKLLCPPEEKKVPQADALGFVLALAAVDVLYLAFLAVQSAGLFGGPEYVEGLGVSYADWARSGFFQMVGVTVVNLSLTLAALNLSRRERRDWTVLRGLCALLVGESLILLVSAAWKMTLYVSAYGLSFKRCMTYWGMGMMALFLLLGLWKAKEPDFRYCKWAFPLALAGWLAINCVPVDYLVAKNQVDRYLSGESAAVSVQYLAYSLSFDTLSQLDRLDGGKPVAHYDGNGNGETLAELLERRRNSAQAQCRNWRSWSLSACLAAGRR